MHFIPYAKHTITSDDKEAVLEALDDPFLTTGPKVEEFEQKIIDYTGAKYAVAVSSGTAALHLSSLVLLKPGDRVLTTPNSFLSTSNAILYAGAIPVFIDIAEDGNMNLDLCEHFLRNDPSIKAIYLVHFSGNPVDMKRVKALKEPYDLVVLEDSAHAFGAEMDDGRVGGCTYSECAIFSFHPVKHLTTGEGGAITTNSKEMAEKLRLLRSHGARKNTQVAPWYYEMLELGYNYRISNFACALGVSQMKRVDENIARRRVLAKRYDQLLSEHPLIEPLYPYNEKSAYHLYVIRIDFTYTSITKLELFTKMRAHNIGLQVNYLPINKQPYYQKLGYGTEQMPEMERYDRESVTIPLYPDLTFEEQDYIVQTLFAILEE